MEQTGNRIGISFKSLKSVLLISFFFSGASALICQVVWVRMFGLVFGITTFAVSSVLTAFMAGLSLGSYYFGKRADKSRNPLRLFAWLEIAIGVFALLFPFLLTQLTGVYVLIHRNISTSFYLFSLIRFLFAFLLLLIPTTLMGGTLPVLSKYFIRELKGLGWDLGSLYSVNNWGAGIGCFLAGFFMIQIIGVKESLYLAATINIFIGLVCLNLGRKAGNAEVLQEKTRVEEKVERDYTGQIYPERIIYFVLWLFAIEGFTSLAYEVLWTRLLVFFLGSITYAFTTIVTSFIFGLALGSFLVGRFIDKRKDLLSMFGFVEIAIGIFAVVLLPSMHGFSFLLKNMQDVFDMSWASVGIRFAICFLIMLVPAMLIGTTFPLVSKIYTRNLKNLGTRVGILGCLDVIGSIAGSFAAGFIMIPLLGTQKGVMVLAAMNLIIGMILIFMHPFLKARVKGAVLAGAVIVATVLMSKSSMDISLPGPFEKKAIPDSEVLYCREGAGATVKVLKRGGERDISIDGYPVAGTGEAYNDIQKPLAHFPLLLHPDPKKILIIGFGAGGTSWSVSQHDVDQIDCVELVPEVIEAAGYFPSVNHNVLKDPRYHVILEDGRNHLLTTDETYDVITVDATSPKLAGNGNLYAKEVYELSVKRLNKNGIMCQWLPYHLLTENETLMILHTFSTVFPYCSLWYTPFRHYYLLIGTLEKTEINMDTLRKRMQSEKVKSDLEKMYLNSPYALVNCFVLDEEAIKRHTGSTKINTDDHPYLEYFTSFKEAPWSFLFDKIEGYPEVTGLNEEEQSLLRAYKQAAGNLHNGIVYLKERALDKAYKEGSRALELTPDDAVAKRLVEVCNKGLEQMYLVQGQKYTNAGKHAEAAEFYKKLVKAIPDHLLALHNLGTSYNELGEYDKAEQVLGTALKYHPNNVQIYNALGTVYSAKGQTESALENFRKAIVSDSTYVATYKNMAAVYFNNGQYERAITELSRAIKIEPGNTEARYYLAMVYDKAQRFDDAKKQLVELLRMHPDFQPAQKALIDINKKLKE